MSWEISTVCKREGPKHKISPLHQENIFKTEEKKDAGNQGQENHSKSLRLGETAGRNLGRLKSDIKKMMHCGQEKNAISESRIN